MTEEFLTVLQVAQMAKVTIQAISRACREGRIKAGKFGNAWFISKAEAKAYAARLGRAAKDDEETGVTM